MPVGVPPKGGPLGRSRSRLSASGLTTYLRCPRQWYLTRKVGLSSPSSIGQITGLVIEDALCRVLMHRPGPMDSLEALRSWAYDLCQEEAKKAIAGGAQLEDVVNVPARTDLMRGRFEKGYNDKIEELVSEMGKQISSSMEAN